MLFSRTTFPSLLFLGNHITTHLWGTIANSRFIHCSLFASCYNQNHNFTSTHSHVNASEDKTYLQSHNFCFYYCKIWTVIYILIICKKVLDPRNLFATKREKKMVNLNRYLKTLPVFLFFFISFFNHTHKKMRIHKPFPFTLEKLWSCLT